MTRRKEYTTAVARREQDPILWVIDGTEIRMRPDVDFDDLDAMLEVAKDATGLKDQEANADVIDLVKQKVEKLRDAIGSYIVEDDQEAYGRIRRRIDIGLALDMVQDVVAEVSGTVPTVQSSLSNGSPPPGIGSIPGAVLGESTPSTSPSTDS